MVDYFDEHDGDPEWEQYNLTFGNIHHGEVLVAYMADAVIIARDVCHLALDDCTFVCGEAGPGGWDITLRWWYPISAKPPEFTLDVTRLVCEHCDWVSEAWVPMDYSDASDADAAATRPWTAEGNLHRWKSPHHHLRFDLRVEHPGSDHVFNRDGGHRCVCGEEAA